MNEAHQNGNYLNFESVFSYQSDRLKQQNGVKELVTEANKMESNCSSQMSVPNANIIDSVEGESMTGTIDWQKVAHKLREYNRKLLKKVSYLEDELAEIDNKFNKYIEKSRNSDLLLASQAKELETYQEQVTLLLQQLTSSQQQIENKELLIKQVTQEHKLSQQQTAQLERECTLLQEQYNQKAFELVAKEQQSQVLQSELDQQQQDFLQQEAQLKKYQEAVSQKEKVVSRHHNYPHNRFIQPWSTTSIPEPKIGLPKNKSQSSQENQPKETIKTAAEIATWSASATSRNKTTQSSGSESQIPPANQNKKPQSLAAVDLPTFPRSQ